MQYSEDGSRAFVITKTPGTATTPGRTTVAVVDTATGITKTYPITVDGTFDSLYPTSRYVSGIQRSTAPPSSDHRIQQLWPPHHHRDHHRHGRRHRREPDSTRWCSPGQLRHGANTWAHEGGGWAAYLVTEDNQQFRRGNRRRPVTLVDFDAGAPA